MHVLLDMKQHHGDEIHYLSFLFVYSWKMGEKLNYSCTKLKLDNI